AETVLRPGGGGGGRHRGQDPARAPGPDGGERPPARGRRPQGAQRWRDAASGGGGGAAVRRLARGRQRFLQRAARRDLQHHRSQRRRQDHPLQLHHRCPTTEARPGPVRRPAGSGTASPRHRGAWYRSHLPGDSPVQEHGCVRERDGRALPATHGRGQYYDVEVAAKKDGTLLGMRMTQYLDVGAYVGTFSAFQACACLMAGGAYKWKGISARTIGILTNRVPTDPYRGAGRPEATHLVERMVDLVALELKMDPVEIRRKNFIQPTEFPFTQNFGLVIDSGDYDKALDRALELVGYKELRKKQADLRKQGRYLGIGISTWIELCGFGPSAATAPATGGIALVESAQVRVTPTGSVIVYTGTHSHGQGHETTFSQIVADQLGVAYDSVELRHGDTSEGTAFGYGTYGSRSLAVGGVAISMAATKVIDKGKKLAAHMLEAAEEDVVFEHGSFHVKGSPDKAKAFGEV